MTKEEVLKARGMVFDAALRLKRAGDAIEENTKRAVELRKEYEAATHDLVALRRSADATEADAVHEATRPKTAEPVAMPGRRAE